jgi:hypothetical protein
MRYVWPYRVDYSTPVQDYSIDKTGMDYETAEEFHMALNPMNNDPLSNPMKNDPTVLSKRFAHWIADSNDLSLEKRSGLNFFTKSLLSWRMPVKNVMKYFNHPSPVNGRFVVTATNSGLKDLHAASIWGSITISRQILSYYIGNNVLT